MKRVITYGTFDLFHKGHYNILKRAKALGDYLIVGVTGENYDAERGKLSVQDSLATRIENVKNTGFADEIIVEEYDGQKINDIIKYKADVLVLGLDWKGKFDHLKKYCDVVYLERTKDISSTQLRKENNFIYNYGIVTDNLLNNDFIFDAEYVSGIHIESVYSEDISIATELCDNLHIDRTFNNLNEFLKSVDIVYINANLEKRYEYIKAALLAYKHVVSDSPMSLDTKKVEELYRLAKQNQLILLDNVPMVYVRTFNQLLSIARGSVIGNIINVKCSLTLEEFSTYYRRSYYEALYYVICTFLKVLGDDFKAVYLKQFDSDMFLYKQVEVDYGKCFGEGEITKDLDKKSYLEITGTKGKIVVPENWWKAAYVEVSLYKENYIQRYCTNFEGNGFRYLIQVMLQMIKEKELESQRLSSTDSTTILHIMNKIIY
ncbi:MAG: adenylyltransferase/cytidyltransferase family protein [Erysipelotrichales bacterium]|nr:adenylyltransferase/cytidyltransferase family protein [Erysipelotrichales bacterium]